MAEILYLVAVLKTTTRLCSRFCERDTILAETKVKVSVGIGSLFAFFDTYDTGPKTLIRHIRDE